MKYEIILTSLFKKELKIIKKRSKDLSKLTEIVNKLARDEELDVKNRDHALINNMRFNNCRECHIEPDWLLVYKKDKNKLILYLIETGSHSDLFH
ncbi:MAG: type II toxin-antitoxin system YafQ family toxin [Bacilli bacterium]|nr:type II toxin-antitoxin system YafQ family toxin [Bacilli bacterium]